MRLLLIALVVGGLGALSGAGLLWGETLGWWAKTLPAAERSQMIAAEDEYYLPDPNRFGPGPYPAVAVMHNCYGGLDQPRMWAKLLAENGYVAQVSDSFTGRGIGFHHARWLACHMLLFYPVERAGDVMTNVQRLQAHNDVDAARVAVWGISHGGTTVMEAVKAMNRQVSPAGFANVPDGFALNQIKAFLIMFPNCGLVNQVRNFHTESPVLWLHGGQDRVTPFNECAAIVANVEENGTPLSVHVYDGADHNFDQLVGGLANPDKEQGKAVLEEAKARSLAFLKRHVKGE